MLGGVDGVTVIDATRDVVSVVDPVILPEAAIMMAEPMFKVAVASPCEPGALLMVAIVASDEVQVTDVVRFRVVPFEKVPMAVSCVVVSGAMLESSGATDRETSTGAGLPVSSFVVPQPRTNAGRSTAATITIHDRNLFFMVPFRPSKFYDLYLDMGTKES